MIKHDIFCCLFCIGLLLGPAVYKNTWAQEPAWEQIASMPVWASSIFTGPAFLDDFMLSSRLNPYLVYGDFNGDGALDIAVLIRRRSDGFQGIGILHGGDTKPIILGAGNAIGNGGDNFDWLGAWSVYPKGPVEKSVYEEGPPPQIRGDLLFVEKLESASGLIYWDGSAYRWYQQGD
ncbi:MAG TPA: hypothetical protein VJL88_08160 [Nitrospira sp.]|nr:hypothetical protein [Nitrospira sp.]